MSTRCACVLFEADAPTRIPRRPTGHTARQRCMYETGALVDAPGMGRAILAARVAAPSPPRSLGPPFPRTRRVHVGVADLSRSITRSASGARLTFAVPHVRVAYGLCNGNSQACCCCYGVWRWYARAWAWSMHAHQPHMPWERCCVKILVRPSEHPCRPRKPAALYMTIVRIHPSTHTCRCTTAHPHACKLFRFLTC